MLMTWRAIFACPYRTASSACFTTASPRCTALMTGAAACPSLGILNAARAGATAGAGAAAGAAAVSASVARAAALVGAAACV